eukprot:169056-Pleurochrysis_carterae.AAC.1
MSQDAAVCFLSWNLISGSSPQDFAREETHSFPSFVSRPSKIDRNCRRYVTLFPCNECAKLIIQSRLAEVVYFSDRYARTQPLDHATRPPRTHMPPRAHATLTKVPTPTSTPTTSSYANTAHSRIAHTLAHARARMHTTRVLPSCACNLTPCSPSDKSVHAVVPVHQPPR